MFQPLLPFSPDITPRLTKGGASWSLWPHTIQYTYGVNAMMAAVDYLAQARRDAELGESLSHLIPKKDLFQESWSPPFHLKPCSTHVWLMRHWPVYTCGPRVHDFWAKSYPERSKNGCAEHDSKTSFLVCQNKEGAPHIEESADICTPLGTLQGIPVLTTPRGGQTTFHDPGQRMIYVMMDLRAQKLSIREFLDLLQTWAHDTLSFFGLQPAMVPQHTGIWMIPKCNDDGYFPLPGIPLAPVKVGSVGVHVRQGITCHGMALNLKTQLSAFQAIHPCGLPSQVMSNLPPFITEEDLDSALFQTCPF